MQARRILGLCIVLALLSWRALSLYNESCEEHTLSIDSYPCGITLDSSPTRSWTLHSDSAERGGDPRRVYAATVPGHATLDVLGVEERVAERDPYYEEGELKAKWIALENWTYTTRIAEDLTRLRCRLPGGCALSFRALDTIALVRLNGVVLGERARNAYHPHVFDIPIDAVMKNHEGLLTVEFESSLAYAAARSKRLGRTYPHTLNYQTWTEPSHRNMLRKPGSDFGWDWGPAFPGPGILGSVVLMRRRGCRRVENVALGQTVSEALGVVRLGVIFELPLEETGLRVDADVVSPSGALVARTSCESVVEKRELRCRPILLPRPRLWYPVGYGDPSLYELRLRSASEICWNGYDSIRFGLRRVELQSQADRVFGLRVNGLEVVLQGTNLVPLDAFPARLRERTSIMYERLLRLVSASHQSTVRVWGGGGFPSREFYDRCDALGILVWQDLPWACGVYPATPGDLASARRETSYLTQSWSRHPSIVVLGGNNEVEASFDWFNETKTDQRDAYRREYARLFLETLPSATRDAPWVYLDSSPSNGLTPWTKRKRWGDVNDPRIGDVHFYRYEGDCEDPQHYPRALLVSEHGVQSQSLRLTREDSRGRRETIERRMRHENGYQEMDANAVRRGFSPLPSRHDELAAYVSQVLQARCLATATAFWRRLPENRGVLLWQLNDVWPGPSWSVLEWSLTGNFVPKPAWYAIRRAFRPQQQRLRPPELRAESDGSLVLETVDDSSAQYDVEIDVVSLCSGLKPHQELIVDRGTTVVVGNLSCDGPTRLSLRLASKLAETFVEWSPSADQAPKRRARKDLLYVERVESAGHRCFVDLARRQHASGKPLYHVWLALRELDRAPSGYWVRNYLEVLRPSETRRRFVYELFDSNEMCEREFFELDGVLAYAMEDVVDQRGRLAE